MTVRELINELNKLSEEAEVLYLHNIHGRISVDTIEPKEETRVSGGRYYTVTLSGAFEEDNNVIY